MHIFRHQSPAPGMYRFKISVEGADEELVFPASNTIAQVFYLNFLVFGEVTNNISTYLKSLFIFKLYILCILTSFLILYK